MKSKAYHLMLSVSSGKKSREFYDALFTLLDWRRVYEDAEAAGYCDDGDFTVWIVPSEEKPSTHTFKAVGFHHFCVRVEDKQSVDDVHNWCIQNNITVVDPPALYPEYSAEYYAVFFLDPDGMKIEVNYL